jgi:mannosyltransferase OCH1-like enzyme
MSQVESDNKTDSNNISKKIPKIIHQIWIGPKPRPNVLMDSWRLKNPDFEYILWNEAEFEKRGIKFECQNRIDSIEEINGKADIIRWEIAYRFGGIFIDADSICVEPIDSYLMAHTAFAGYENETMRPTLVATGTMGFPPEYPLCRAAIDWILKNPVSQRESGRRAWFNVGPGLLTLMLSSNLYPEFKVLPSHTFLPIHYTGHKYEGHDKVYAYQEWGSTKQSYDTMNSVTLPSELLNPDTWVSVLIPSFNTKPIYIKECLDSIKAQVGNFGMEIVWVNDGSNEINTKILEGMLKRFEETTRFIKVVYLKQENQGVCHSLKNGLELCTNEIIIRMDSDDIMFPHRIQTQLYFMNTNPDAVCLGTNLQFIYETGKMGTQTTHPIKITWDDYKKTRGHWIMNHPTMCFRKSKVLAAGGYDPTTGSISEDFEMELRIMKMYGAIHNLPEILLYYRIHGDQVTFNGKSSTPFWREKRDQFINSLINS